MVSGGLIIVVATLGIASPSHGAACTAIAQNNGCWAQWLHGLSQTGPNITKTYMYTGPLGVPAKACAAIGVTWAEINLFGPPNYVVSGPLVFPQPQQFAWAYAPVTGPGLAYGNPVAAQFKYANSQGQIWNPAC
jgi:hypothetical protein